MQKTVERILRARVYDVAHETPLSEAKVLSERLGNKVLLKREDMQPVFSFKLRGAYNRMINLDQSEREAGVVAASAGNHAQGVALAAARMGIKATIVMPKTTPKIKVDSVRSRGGKVVLEGESYDDAYEHALKLCKEGGQTFIHPYDDPEVIAGQGTIAMELLRQASEGMDAIFVPVGGGGLIAGVAAYIKFVRPEIKVIGVEPEDAACLHAAMKAGRRKDIGPVGLFADGVAVKIIGKETFRICKQTVDDVILVNSDEICAAIKDIFTDTRSIAEPAGALAVAGLKKYATDNLVEDQTLTAIVSGANMNFDRLRHVAERAELGEQREGLLSATIPEKPGSFRRFCETLGSRSITEFNYRYSDDKDAQVFVGVQLNRGLDEWEEVKAKLEGKGYPVLDMTDNELAKLHVRYMVGGHVKGVENEVLYRFEFPERPGALLKFLKGLGRHWNISLFHYRNHGADYGRVLVGMQLPEEDRQSFQTFLNGLGYRFFEETNNPAYQHFISAD